MLSKHAPSEKRHLNHRSILWKHMIMMLAILLMAVAGLAVIHQFSITTLTKEYLAEFQAAFERDCTNLDDSLCRNMSLTYAVEGSRHYEYIKNINTGVLEQKYCAVLEYLRASLNNQIYLKGDCSECLIYFGGVNSITTTTTSYYVAEDCFDSGIRFADLDTQIVMGHLRARSNLAILPMQSVALASKHPERMMTLIFSPVNGKNSVLWLYSEDQILQKLGFRDLPANSCLQLTAADGQILEQYPVAADDAWKEHSYFMSCKLEKLKITVSVWIPEQYFEDALSPVKWLGIQVIVLVMLVGLILAYYLSKVSVKPIRELISTHDDVGEAGQFNEIDHLGQILDDSRQQTEAMRDRLSRQILLRAISGAMLSEAEESTLRQLPFFQRSSYCVAVLHSAPTRIIDFEAQLRQQPGMLWAVINEMEAVLVLREEQIIWLTESIDRLNAEAQEAENQIFCGLSASAEEISSLYVAVHQARCSIPPRAGVNRFGRSSDRDQKITWLQHERLYQSIFTNNQEGSKYLLSALAAQADYGNAQELYYNLRFVIRCTAEEMDVQFSPEELPDYRPQLLPWENIAALQELLTLLFRRLSEKQTGKTLGLQDAVLEYIRQNASDSELFAGKVAEHFGVSEKHIYELVRKATDKSFNEYLLGLRMAMAARLLCGTQKSTAQIAEECGYQGKSTFYRAFGKYYNMPPVQFRKLGAVSADPTGAAGSADAETEDFSKNRQ